MGRGSWKGRKVEAVGLPGKPDQIKSVADTKQRLLAGRTGSVKAKYITMF